MVFLAQGESPTSCAGELGRNPAAPMLQHILKKNLLLITASASEAGPGFRAGAGIGFRIPLTGGHQIRADASYNLAVSSPPSQRVFVCLNLSVSSDPHFLNHCHIIASSILARCVLCYCTGVWGWP